MNNKCQVFTPNKYVNFMLDSVSYIDDLYGKKVLENSCGVGNILCEIVKRYIIDCKKRKMSLKKIKLGLEKDIFAYEIDSQVANICRERLNQLAEEFSLKGVKWNIIEHDFLMENIELYFDFIIGNPPYIRYSELDSNTRIRLKEKFNSCKNGKFDYCYPFIEKSLNHLTNRGKMVYLIPNSIFKNVFAEELRTIILPKINTIYDYKSKKIFESVLTSSAIIVLNNFEFTDAIEYVNMLNNTKKRINKGSLGKKWTFLKNPKRKNRVRFSDYFVASISVATLLNKAFVLSPKEIVESAVLRKAVSPKNLIKGKEENIIFPYKYNKNNEIIRYSEPEFIACFPLAYAHLDSFREEMEKRKIDKNCRFHEFGRSQALKHLNQEKLVLSTIITKSVKVYEVGRDVIPYSGIYIVKRKNGIFNLEFARKILESARFMNYVKNIGVNATGISLRITSQDINDFDISFFLK